MRLLLGGIDLSYWQTRCILYSSPLRFSVLLVVVVVNAAVVVSLYLLFIFLLFAALYWFRFV